jgi:hypothetical protein
MVQPAFIGHQLGHAACSDSLPFAAVRLLPAVRTSSIYFSRGGSLLEHPTPPSHGARHHHRHDDRLPFSGQLSWSSDRRVVMHLMRARTAAAGITPARLRVQGQSSISLYRTGPMEHSHAAYSMPQTKHGHLTFMASSAAGKTFGSIDRPSPESVLSRDGTGPRRKTYVPARARPHLRCSCASHVPCCLRPEDRDLNALAFPDCRCPCVPVSCSSCMAAIIVSTGELATPCFAVHSSVPLAHWLRLRLERERERGDP